MPIKYIDEDKLANVIRNLRDAENDLALLGPKLKNGRLIHADLFDIEMRINNNLAVLDCLLENQTIGATVPKEW